MEIKKITDPAFKKYGKIIENIDFSNLVKVLEKTPAPEDVVYEPSVPELEATPEFQELQTKTYGELPIQIGYCNGKNHLLNAFEYHRSSEINIGGTDAILFSKNQNGISSSEINIGGTDAILILGEQKDVSKDFTYNTSLAEAFLLPKYVAVELYATTLHYAPCSVGDEVFRVAIVLPKDTNLPLEEAHKGWEDKLLTAKNKWLIGHPEGGLAEGTHLGLIGKNLSVKE